MRGKRKKKKNLEKKYESYSLPRKKLRKFCVWDFLNFKTGFYGQIYRAHQYCGSSVKDMSITCPVALVLRT